MNNTSYSSFTFYGYKIIVPDDTTYRQFINRLFGLNSILEEPFRITGVLSKFKSALEDLSDDELIELDKNAHLIIGFIPSDNLTELVEKSTELGEFITNNPILDGLEFSTNPGFFSGIDWFDNIIDIDDDSDLSELEDKTDLEDDDDISSVDDSDLDDDDDDISSVDDSDLDDDLDDLDGSLE
jgi:hypothetical protein